MKKLNFQKLFLLALLGSFTLNAFAWDHSVEIGYGRSPDKNHRQYYNSGVFLNGDIWSFRKTPYTHWSLNGAIGQWYTTTPVNKNLTTAALSVVLRLYPWTSALKYPPYLLGSVGPAYISSKEFGYNTQAANATFQWTAGLGAEFKNIDLNFRFVHFSNAYIARPDEGFTVLYLLSLGYLF
ncbi:MAG: acyloxyacyl hydrolase [Pseudomonadota bacterium]